MQRYPILCEIGTDKFVSQVSPRKPRKDRPPASPYIVCVAEKFYWIGEAQKSPKGDAKDPVCFSEIHLWKCLDEHVLGVCCHLRIFKHRACILVPSAGDGKRDQLGRSPKGDGFPGSPNRCRNEPASTRKISSSVCSNLADFHMLARKNLEQSK